MGGGRPRRGLKSIDDDVNDNVDRLLDCFKRGMSCHTPSPTESAHKERTWNHECCSGSKSDHGKSSINVQSTSANSLKQVKDDTPKPPQQVCSDSVASPNPTSRQQQNCSKQISPGVFYGSPDGKPSKKPPQLLRLLHEIRKDLTEQNNLHPRAIWATFPRQDQAIQFAESHTQVAVFSYQDHVNGQRRFLATTYEEFWLRYKNMDPKYRHHYEVIQEGKPCHLYFDLEYYCAANVEANGVGMVDLLLSVVSDAMLDIYNLQFEPDWTIELDSSTGEKFSRHLIIRVPNAAFKDNSHVGAFVGEICARIVKLREIDTKFNQLYVSKRDGCTESHPELFLDSAVYSRNRCFRLLLSSKAGKSVSLLPTRRFRCKDMTEYQIFMESLICRMDINCERLLTFDAEAIGNGGGITDLAHSTDAVKRPKKVMESSTSGKSPFPALDSFVESVACVGNVPGSIRSWYWFSEYGVMVYNISGNRFCENIGRQHKSNHVMYIVDFRTAGYYQKCHDPDCKGYRSPLRPIPEDTIPWSFLVLGAAQRRNNEGENNVGILQLSLAMTLNDNSISSTFDATSTSFIEGMFSERSGKDSWEDEAWWEEVINTIEDMESEHKSLEPRKQECMSTSDDDEWWMAVERKASELEKMTE